MFQSTHLFMPYINFMLIVILMYLVLKHNKHHH